MQWRTLILLREHLGSGTPSGTARAHTVRRACDAPLGAWPGKQRSARQLRGASSSSAQRQRPAP